MAAEKYPSAVRFHLQVLKVTTFSLGARDLPKVNTSSKQKLKDFISLLQVVCGSPGPDSKLAMRFQSASMCAGGGYPTLAPSACITPGKFPILLVRSVEVVIGAIRHQLSLTHRTGATGNSSS